MTNVVTNRGRYMILNSYFRDTNEPTNFYLALVTSANTPTVDTNTLSDLTEIAAGNGYTAGGTSINRDSTDFPTITEDDTNDLASVELKDIAWTASGGSIPGSGDGARWAVLLDDNATAANRQVIAAADLGSDRSVSDGQTLTIEDFPVRFTTP